MIIRAALICALFASAVCAQQDYIGRFDIYGGFSYLESPHINLAERGFEFQTGMRVRTWMTLGFDYAVFTGHTDLKPGLLTTSLQTQLRQQLAALIAAHIIPPTYSLVVPIDSTTQTFAAGPQFSYRRWNTVTLFVRPSIGAIYEKATPHATDAIAQGVINQLAPSGNKTDWVPFYGFGGGFDANLTHHFAIRFQADFVHDHLFSDLLKDGRNSIRFSMGPALQFGSNVRK